MNTILDQLQELANADLYALSEAVDTELQRREDITDEASESARRRAVEREESYRHRTGAAATPVRIIGIGKATKTRRAA
jgi:hypothetical protein